MPNMTQLSEADVALAEELLNQPAPGQPAQVIYQQPAEQVYQQPAEQVYQQPARRSRMAVVNRHIKTARGLGKKIVAIGEYGVVLAIVFYLWRFSGELTLAFAGSIGLDLTWMILAEGIDLRWIVVLPFISLIQWGWMPFEVGRHNGRWYADRVDLPLWMIVTWCAIMVISLGSTYGGAVDLLAGKTIPLFGGIPIPTTGIFLIVWGVGTSLLCDFFPERIGGPALQHLLAEFGIRWSK